MKVSGILHHVREHGRSRHAIAALMIAALAAGCATECPPCETSPTLVTAAPTTAPVTAAPTTTVDACTTAVAAAQLAHDTVEALQTDVDELVVAAAETAEAELLERFAEAPQWRIDALRESAAENALEEWAQSPAATALETALVEAAGLDAAATATCQS